MNTLIERLKNPEDHYEFSDPKKANAVLMSLCQEAADALADIKQDLTTVQEPALVVYQGEIAKSTLPKGFTGVLYTTPPAQPVPASWMEMVVANLVREGVNKHKARDLAEHFYGLAQPAPVQEPLEYWNAVEGWVKIDEVREHFNSVGCGTIYKNAGEDRVPLYAAAQRQWVGLTDEEITELEETTTCLANESWLRNLTRAIEAKLKEKNI